MSTTTRHEAGTVGRIALVRAVGAAAMGGLAGGIVFGMMMQVMGAIPMIAQLVGSDAVAVGWLVHLAISVSLGAGFGLVVGSRLDRWRPGLVLGVGYGMVWWVLGALIAMPARLGMPLFTLDTMAWQSLMGHMIYGGLLGAVAVALMRAGRSRTA